MVTHHLRIGRRRGGTFVEPPRKLKSDFHEPAFRRREMTARAARWLNGEWG